MATRPKKVKVSKKNKKGLINFKRFVQEAHRAEGKEVDDSEEFKLRRKVIVKFYKLCAGNEFSREKVEKFLRNKGYGDPGDVLDDDHWSDVEKIREISNTSFCNGERY